MSSKINTLFDLWKSSIDIRELMLLITVCFFMIFPLSYVMQIGTVNTLQAVLLLRRWLVYLFFSFLSLLVPMILVWIVFIDLMTSNIMEDLLILPLGRNKIFIVGFLFYIFLNFLLGLLIGYLLYMSCNIGTYLTFSQLSFSLNIILAVSILVTVFSIIYGSICLLITFLFGHNQEVLILIFYFLCTFVWNSLFWNVGGKYVILSYTFYKIQLFTHILPRSELNRQLSILLPMSIPFPVFILILSSLCVLFFAFTHYTFKREDF